jgi:hypothetical protein
VEEFIDGGLRKVDLWKIPDWLNGEAKLKILHDCLFFLLASLLMD